MSNLLSFRNQEILQRDFYLRAITVGCFLLSIAFGIGCAALLPGYFLAEAQNSAVNQALAVVLSESEALSSRTDMLALDTLRGLVAALAPQGYAGDPSLLFGQARSAASSDVNLQTLSFQMLGETPQLLIGGVAATRGALDAYAVSLRSVPAFSKIDVPVSNFASDKNTPFTITVTLK